MPKLVDNPLYHVVPTRLTNSDYDQLVAIANRSNLTTTALIRYLVQEYLRGKDSKTKESA